MTQKADLALWLLQGKKVSIMDGFKLFGITNVPREIGRQIERIKTKEHPEYNGFGVECKRTERKGLTRGGQACNWMEYTLPKTPENAAGIERMKAYISSQMNTNPKTTQEQKALAQAKLLLQ